MKVRAFFFFFTKWQRTYTTTHVEGEVSEKRWTIRECATQFTPAIVTLDFVALSGIPHAVCCIEDENRFAPAYTTTRRQRKYDLLEGEFPTLSERVAFFLFFLFLLSCLSLFFLFPLFVTYRRGDDIFSSPRFSSWKLDKTPKVSRYR